MTPLGWGWAAFVWGYALIWFLVSDRIKLLAYRILDPATATTAAEHGPRVSPKQMMLPRHTSPNSTPTPIQMTRCVSSFDVSPQRTSRRSNAARRGTDSNPATRTA